MSDPSIDHTMPQPPRLGTTSLRNILDRQAHSSLRNGILSVGVAGFITMANGHVLPSVQGQPTVRFVILGLLAFGFFQLVRWTIYRRLVAFHDHLSSDHALSARAPAGAWSVPTEAARPAGRGNDASSAEVRWFGSTSDAQHRGWRFFEKYGMFAGSPVARFAEHAGAWHEYIGLASPDIAPGGQAVAPPAGTVRFGNLLYRHLPSPPEGVVVPGP